MQLRVERIASPLRVAVLAITAFAWATMAHPAGSNSVLARVALIVGAVYAIANAILIFRLPQLIGRQPWASTALDFAFIAVWMFASGGPATSFVTLALVGAASAPPRNSPRISLIATAGYALAVIAIAGLTHWPDALFVLAVGWGLTLWAAVNYRDRRKSLRDDLTGSFTREYADFRLSDVYDQDAFPIAVAVIDLDGFKNVNDTFGHPAGDTVLVQAVRAIATAIRQGDLLARSGGDEFMLILPHTDIDAAGAVAERVRSAIGLTRFHHRRDMPPVRLTASIGVAVTEDEHTDRSTLVKRADDLLYRAKTTGRDRVAI